MKINQLQYKIPYGAYCQVGGSYLGERCFRPAGERRLGVATIFAGWPDGPGTAWFCPLSAHGGSTTHLHGKEGARLPRWLSDTEWAGRMVLHSENGLPVQIPGRFKYYAPDDRAFSLQVSTPERAVLE